MFSKFLPQRTGFLDHKTECSLGVGQRVNGGHIVYDLLQEVGLTYARLGCTELEVGEVDVEMVVGGLVVYVCSEPIFCYSILGTNLLLQ